MNLAIAECTGRYVALLNSDGRPEPGMLRTLAASLDAEPGAIWAAPAVHGPGERSEPPGPPFDEDALAGTALLIRREAFVELGGFDPLYWFYNEDYDASRRARAAGHRLLRVPDAVFHHGKGGRSRRGQLIREWWYAVTDQTLVHHHDPSRARAVRRVAAGRTRSLREHGRARSWPALAALSAATVAWPASAALAERRRRAPWGAERLQAWLARERPELERHVVGPGGSAAIPSRPAHAGTPRTAGTRRSEAPRS
jgi:GT2 family glycosyltransferase